MVKKAKMRRKKETVKIVRRERGFSVVCVFGRGRKEVEKREK